MSNQSKVYMLPQLDIAENIDGSNTIHQIVVRLAKHLPAFGYEIVSGPSFAEIVVAHAGMGQEGEVQPDVAICHGLYPTGETANPVTSWHWGANRNVVSDLRNARRITVPSQWVADIIRRDMHVDPAVVPWAVEASEWEPLDNEGYVLWAKTRPDGVCDPGPIIELAARVPGERFLTTFGQGTPNLRTVGRQTFPIMRDLIRHAGVYLSTAKETFGITTLEAMASGVPVLGYRWGGTINIVEHGVTGYLAEPGDLNGLREGLDYVLKHRAILGANARTVARTYTWEKTAEQFANVFSGLKAHHGPKVTVVIPCHNYAQYVGTAIDSVKSQQTEFPVEIIVVTDRCTDNSEAVVLDHLAELTDEQAQWLTADYGNPADTRNQGIEQARGEYIVCLDADDALGDVRFLQILADALNQDRGLGIVFTGLRVMDADGNLGNLADWPNGYDYDAQCARHNQVPTCCMFRKEAWVRAGGYRRRYVPAEDADLWLRMGAVGYRAKQIVRDPWFVYRLHGDSLSTEIRTGKKPEPDWVGDKPWTVDGKRPFAADGIAPVGSWPVRNYDLPKVSVIVPCAGYHHHLLPEALDSIESQTERKWECIVVNDGLEPLDLTSYPWVKVVNTGGNRGPGYARNQGIKAAVAPMVAFLDADDVFSTRFLEVTLRAFARTGRYVYTDWISLNKEGVYEPHATPDYDPGEVFYRTSIHSINILIPRAEVLKVGGFDVKMPSWEDVDFFMKLAAAGICGVRVPEPLVLYRYSTGNLREHGETIKSDLKSLLHTRYLEYIEGRKMCDCGKPLAPKSNGTATAVGPGDAGAMVRIEYVGPTGQHSVIGMITKQNYGRRAGGDTFYVYAIDQQAQTDRFILFEEVGNVVQETVAPPEPVLL